MKEENYDPDKLTPEEILELILLKKTTFEKLRGSGTFPHSKQQKVRALLNDEDEKSYKDADSLENLKKYMQLFPKGLHFDEASKKALAMEEENNAAQQKRIDTEKIIHEIERDLNKYTVGEIKEKLSPEDLNQLCNRLGLDLNLIDKYKDPVLEFNDIPEKAKDIPREYTDVFFWGIPSSGKTCALSAILSTIKKNYTMEPPDLATKFGSVYRTNLVNIFRNDYGYLPNATAVDRTQYMPFLFYKRGEKKKRKISFFELSGEVFKNFNVVVNNADTKISEEGEAEINKTFSLIELLLKSTNKKIHYFFIDYKKEKEDNLDNNFTQEDYLGAAATYFKDRKNIFKNNTDAVYVVITKSDEIDGCDRQQQMENAESFLKDKFGNFLEILKRQCDTYSIDFNIKLFSIGDVYFKRICRINRSFSTEIIEDLLEHVPAVSNNFWRKFLNS